MTAKKQNNIEFWAQTDVGMKRDHNEDNFLVDKKLNLFVVADGMGGHAAGEVASGVAVKTMERVIAENKDLLDAFKEDSPIASKKDVNNLMEHGIHKACKDIFDMGERDPAKRGMGTTLSAMLIIGDTGFMAHVGDSRIYLSRAGRVIQLSEDHSLVNELIKRGKLSSENVEDSPYKNAVTRAVGVYETVEVDTMSFEILPGDHYLLASDGLTGYLENSEIPSLISSAETIKDLPQKYIDLANDRGGKDNITAITIHISDQENQAEELNKEIETKLSVINRMPLFKHLSDSELLRVMNITKVVPIKPTDAIIRQGDKGDTLFIILSGKVKVHLKDKFLVTLEAGAHFGEMALVDNSPRSADVTATSEGKLLVITREDFLNIIKNETAMAKKLLWSFIQELSSRLRTTNKDTIQQSEEEEIEDLTDELFG